MLPYSEMDNYKLQVELLQEKLQRSEDNRKKLEHKLEHAIQKKSEQEKIVRAKQREKYQDFLGELEKRNERNRQLMKMLERVDQQTASLSARSERLRMMKMQYEMYFAKLVQTQTMRCIQATAPTATPATFLTTAPTPIPVLLPTTPPLQQQQQQQQSTVMIPAPIKNNEQAPLTSAVGATAARTAPATTAIYQCDASGNLIAAGTAAAVAAAPTPATHMPVPFSHIGNATGCNTITPHPTATLPALAAPTQHWTLALATPTPAGMLLTSNPPTAPANLAATATDYMGNAAPTLDYMQYPLGYLPTRRMRNLLPQQPNMSIYSDESDDLLPPMRANTSTKSDRYLRSHRQRNMDNDNDMSTYDYSQEPPINDAIEETREAGASNRMDLPTRQLDSDKISEVSTTQAQTQLRRRDNAHQGSELPPQTAPLPTSSSASLLTLDKLPKTMTMTEHDDTALFATTPIDDRNNDVDDGSNKNNNSNNNNNIGDEAKVAKRFDEFSKGISMIGGADKGAFLPQFQRSEEDKRSQSNAVTAATIAPDTITNTTTTTDNVISNDNGSFIEANLRQKIDSAKPWQQQPHMTQSWHHQAESTATTSGGKDNTLRFEEMTAGFTEYAAESGAANNGGSNTAKMSIEKIENEIYGELVNPPAGEADSTDARNAAQGLVSELVTQQQQQQLQPDEQEVFEPAAQLGNYAADDPNNAANVYDQSTSESYDPTYATIEGTTNAEVYPTPVTDEANADYNAQYATDAVTLQQQQQDYANIDYANYDATQYAADGAYDPNMYPGYTYDEATGQYTPDPGYAEQAVYEQQQYDPSQTQAQNYDYSNYEQQVTETAPTNEAYDESIAATAAGAGVATIEQQPQNGAQFAPTNTEIPDTVTTPTMSTNKPASILSSGDKHAANEAQKKKKRVNFVDSSETDDSSSVKQAAAAAPGDSASGGAANESDFDFSSNSEKSGNSVGGAA